jgi:glycosyltransferase involved in cell wall biosynthesis
MLEALSHRVDELVVLCDTAVPGAAPAGVEVRTFAAGSRLGRGARFERALAREVARGRVPVVAHMVPLYAILAAPLTRPLGARLALWYTHWNPTRELRLAARLCTDLLSVDRASFPLSSSRLHAIGHGIDTTRFTVPRAEGDRLRLAALGRMSPMKRYPTLLRAVRRAREEGVDLELEIRGPALTDEERRERQEVEGLVATLGLEGNVVVGDPVPWADVPSVLARTDVLVNLAEAADKIVYEAAAAGALVLASAPAFAGFLPAELRFPREDADALAARIVELATRTAEARAAEGEELRARVARMHSVESWADAIVRIAGQPR